MQKRHLLIATCAIGLIACTALAVPIDPPAQNHPIPAASPHAPPNITLTVYTVEREPAAVIQPKTIEAVTGTDSHFEMPAVTSTWAPKSSAPSRPLIRLPIRYAGTWCT